VVSLSTTKEEYHGPVRVGIESTWIQYLMSELGFLVMTSSMVYVDNQSVI